MLKKYKNLLNGKPDYLFIDISSFQFFKMKWFQAVKTFQRFLC